MRIIPPPGWSLPWAGHFMNKRLCIEDQAIVYAWPSTGGRLELENPSAFELDYLGIKDHFTEANCSADVVEEDAFARKLRSLGGTFKELQYGTKHDELADEEIHTWIGWPEDEEHKGGVWVLKVKKEVTSRKMTRRIRLAKTMQERCQTIEMCGGRFYTSPAEEHLVAMDPRPRLSRLEAEKAAKRWQETCDDS